MALRSTLRVYEGSATRCYECGEGKRRRLASYRFDPLTQNQYAILRNLSSNNIPLSGQTASSSSSGSSINSSSSSSPFGSSPLITTSPPLRTPSFFLARILYGSYDFPSGARNIRVGN